MLYSELNQKELKELKELKNRYAYIKNKPITKSSEMIKDIELCISCVDEIVEDLVEEHKLDALYQGANEFLIKKLEEKLCSFEGELLCYDIDEYSELILNEGQLWYGEDSFLEEMEIGNCNDNCIKINDSNPEHPIVVGYALSDYGFWYVHTWLLVEDKEKERNFVLETTMPAKLYFGVVLTKNELIKFKSNLSR